MSRLPEVVQALLNPDIYPDKAGNVELTQTQMSFIFFAGDYVYKIKKPVNLGYLDYTTLEKRHDFCVKEVELNRRLCPGAYLGVIPVAREPGGHISLMGRGEIIEYAVKMRKLPQELMLDALLKKNGVSPEMLTRVANRLVAFHRSADTVTTGGGLDTVIQNTEENFSQSEKYIPRVMSSETFRRITSYSRDFVKRNAGLFHRRIAEGRIRDCHGDLHAAHVCITDDICIYDCIEFNDRFRYCDVASEIAFLAMDLDHYDRSDLSGTFIDAYVKMSGDKEIKQMLNYYKCYRAYVRGKVNCFKLDDHLVTEKDKEQAQETARSYFRLAQSYV
ncbi:gluconokinase [Chloroflexota bacterium]